LKKIVHLLLLLVCLLPVFSENCLAASDSGRVYDEAGLLSEGRINELEAQLREFRETYQIDLAVVTITDARGMGAFDYAENYYAENGFGAGENRDGGLLLIDMDNREAAIYTYGKLQQHVSDRKIQKITDAIAGKLAKGEYDDATGLFVPKITGYVKSATKIQPIEVAAIFGIALLVFLAGVLIVRYRYRRHGKKEAYPFRERSTLKLTGQEDIFINTTRTRRRIETNSGSPGRGGGGGSSGRGGGGASSKF